MEQTHIYILLKLRKENLTEEKIIKFENERKNRTFYVLIPFHNEDYALEIMYFIRNKKCSSLFQIFLLNIMMNKF